MTDAGVVADDVHPTEAVEDLLGKCLDLLDPADPANWPNDPGYGYNDSNDGQWNLYSFMPTTATHVRSQETASGMSFDLAWRLTIGDPSILIAITDSGTFAQFVMIASQSAANRPREAASV